MLNLTFPLIFRYMLIFSRACSAVGRHSKWAGKKCCSGLKRRRGVARSSRKYATAWRPPFIVKLPLKANMHALRQYCHVFAHEFLRYGVPRSKLENGHGVKSSQRWSRPAEAVNKRHRARSAPPTASVAFHMRGRLAARRSPVNKFNSAERIGRSSERYNPIMHRAAAALARISERQTTESVTLTIRRNTADDRALIGARWMAIWRHRSMSRALLWCR